ncbi:hypothetical protein SELMODRAFT_117499 [Selaginella moellendorffii]|uniref:L-dopachrome isomerase n=1 Tax=Selaginella moellendorffii TaxID=88036 RepID=D8SI87_SELML|nr:hypothetical protein SELMODRAFT_117499 [Selaginella moellendorffii]
MPVLTIHTNVVLLDGSLMSSVVSKLSHEVAKTTGKPESYVMVLLHGGVTLAFQGSHESAAAYGELVSIGGLSPGVNQDLCKAIARVLEEELKVPPSRCYIKFYQEQACVLRIWCSVSLFLFDEILSF